MFRFSVLALVTSIAVYLDPNGGCEDTRLISLRPLPPAGGHLRDFVFNAGFYTASDMTGPGAGTNRFVVSAGTTSGRANSFPKNTGAVAIGTTGWYLFQHKFVNNGLGVLSVEMSITDTSNNVVFTQTVSNPTDTIGSTVGGNRYGWFPNNEFVGILAIDDSSRSNFVPDNRSF